MWSNKNKRFPRSYEITGLPESTRICLYEKQIIFTTLPIYRNRKTDYYTLGIIGHCSLATSYLAFLPWIDAKKYFGNKTINQSWYYEISALHVNKQQSLQTTTVRIFDQVLVLILINSIYTICLSRFQTTNIFFSIEFEYQGSS